MATATTEHEPRELAYRESDGIQVTLYWHGGGELTLHVLDTRTSTWFDLDVDPRRALDTFYHPFAYAPLRAARLACVR